VEFSRCLETMKNPYPKDIRRTRRQIKALFSSSISISDTFPRTTEAGANAAAVATKAAMHRVRNAIVAKN
jgi:hypothetical protein